MKLTTETYSYPNPEHKWCIVKMDGMEIGRCDVRPDGYLLRGGRKVRPLEEVAGVLVRATIADAQDRKEKANADEVRAAAQLKSLKKQAKHKTPNGSNERGPTA